MDFSYQTTPMKIGPINTSKEELIDIAKAWLGISLAFSFVLNVAGFSFIEVFALSLATVGLGFLLHELAHKIVAQHYGCFAEFRAFNEMIIIALLLSYFLKVVFAAPGAVMISGPIGKRRNGKISLAGPLTNAVLAFIFLMIFFLSPESMLKVLAGVGFTINSWLALFNLIPVWNLDGKKIWDWSKAIYLLMLAVCIVFFVTGMILKISF